MGFLFPGCVLCVCYHWHGAIPRENPVLPSQLKRSSRPGMWESSSQGFPVCPWEVLQEQLQQLRLVLHRAHGAHCGQPVARYPLWGTFPAGSLGHLLSLWFLPQLLLFSFPLTPTPLFANGFANVTAQPAKLYFIAFHIVMVIIIVKYVFLGWFPLL